MTERLSEPTRALLDHARMRAMKVPFDPETLLAEVRASAGGASVRPTPKAPTSVAAHASSSVIVKLGTTLAVLVLVVVAHQLTRKRKPHLVPPHTHELPTMMRSAQQVPPRPIEAPPAPSEPPSAIAPPAPRVISTHRRALRGRDEGWPLVPPPPLEPAEPSMNFVTESPDAPPVHRAPAALRSEFERAVNDLLRAHMPAFRQCYQQAAARDTTLGEVHTSTHFHIGPRGAVTAASTTWFEHAPTMGTCIEERVREIAFPAPPDGEAWFGLPLHFTLTTASPLPTVTQPGELPPRPTQADVLRAMREISASIRACGAFSRAVVRFAFNASGDVQQVTLVPDHEVIPNAGCVLRAASTARIAPFRDGPFYATYPFSGAPRQPPTH